MCCATLPAMAGTTAPPTTSPRPTTMPVAVVARYGGTDSFVNGPTTMVKTPAFRKVITKSAANSLPGSAPICISMYRPTISMAMATSMTSLRFRRSESAGISSIPRQPPSPMPDMVIPICSMPSLRWSVR